MCNNFSVATKMDRASFLHVPGGENAGVVTPSGSSNELCPVHRALTRSLSMEELYMFGRRREKQRPRSKRRKSTQVCRENSKKSHRSSTRRSKHSYHEHPPHPFLHFENETAKVVGSSRNNSLDIPPLALLRSNSQRSSRKSSYGYPDYAKDSLSSYKRKTSLSLNLTEEELLKYKRRRKIVTVIIVTFGILVFVCIMAVIVSLTHRSTVTVTRNNSTVNVTYYTFSPHAGIVCEFEDGRLCSQGK